MFLFSGIGSIISPLIVDYFRAPGSLNAALLVIPYSCYAVLSLTTAAWAVIVIKRFLVPDATVSRDSTIDINSRSLHGVKKNDEELNNNKNLSGILSSYSSNAKKLKSCLIVAAFFITCFVDCGIESTTASFLSTYVSKSSERLGLTTDDAARMISVFFASGTVSRIICLITIPRTGVSMHIIVTSILMSLVSGLLLVMSGSSYEKIMLWITVIVIAACKSSNIPCAFSIMDKSEMGVTSLVSSSATIAMTTASLAYANLIAYTIEEHPSSFTISIFVSTVLLVMSFVVMILIKKGGLKNQSKIEVHEIT